MNYIDFDMLFTFLIGPYYGYFILLLIFKMFNIVYIDSCKKNCRDF